MANLSGRVWFNRRTRNDALSRSVRNKNIGFLHGYFHLPNFCAPAAAQGPWPPASPEAVDFRHNIKDILFAFDQYEDPTNKATLDADVAYLMAHPDVRIRIDGYTDSRGDIVYNLVLAQKRADIARQDLIRLGVPAERIVSAVGSGKLYPTCDFES